MYTSARMKHSALHWEYLRILRLKRSVREHNNITWSTKVLAVTEYASEPVRTSNRQERETNKQLEHSPVQVVTDRD